MGSSQSVFTEQELNDYQELTYFTKKEILHVFKRFSQLNPDALNKDKNAKLGRDEILELQELKVDNMLYDLSDCHPENHEILIRPLPVKLGVNPFKDRICQVFSSGKDGDMTFEDFLDMMSVFSDNAPKSVKVEYAFRIYDFDEDDMISSKDLKEVVDRLTGAHRPDGQKLEDEDMQQLIDNIFEEADLDDDDSLSFAEFEHVISKAPDFVNSFRIRL